ncbi:MAG: 16S rRNA (cytosine(1402)-N(4))-methyltransferase RsmH [Bacteroidales bacterium]|nr:16S rRNA (cytosine(1402)-N(4))-methyltransferase RsmH [Bacteroidales bacterium]
MNSDQTYHVPVMLREVLEGLRVDPSGVYVDVTFGGGGHSRAILSLLGDSGRLLAFDQDEDAAANVPDDPRFTLIVENFSHLKSFLRLHGVRQVNGILADLGVSSHQFDTAERGFSTRLDGELDMRMDRRNPVTARQIVATYDEEDLFRLLRLYGELPNARQMARAIVAARQQSEIVTTADLREAVRRHLPRGMENKYLAMLFQALRIEVGGELEALRQLLLQAGQLLVPGGRLAVISYHSLEDRLVKNYMRSGNFDGEVEKDFYGNPLVPMRQCVKCAASAAEVAANPRARSARLRVAEKLATEQ